MDCNLKDNRDILIAFGRNIHKWPSNDRSSIHLAQRLFLHYLRKAEQAKYALK